MDRFIPIFIIEKIFILRVILHYFECKPFSKNINSKKAIIIGNGPSLLKTIEQNLNELQNNDCFMVNNAAIHNCFVLIKPQYYVFADPDYFQKDFMNKVTSNVLEAFERNLKWQMTVFLPVSSKNTLFEIKLKNIKYISLVYYSSVYSSFFVKYINRRRLFRFWNKNIARPLSQTVLNTASSIAISMKYKEIFLVGADTSWTEMLYVDQTTNDIYSYDRHFYDSDKRLLYKYSEAKSNLAEDLLTIANALESYQIIKEYAYYNECKIYNASEYSFIDTLVRKKL